MDAYDRCTNLETKNLANIVAIYGRSRELFRPPTYLCEIPVFYLSLLFCYYFYYCYHYYAGLSLLSVLFFLVWCPLPDRAQS